VGAIRSDGGRADNAGRRLTALLKRRRKPSSKSTDHPAARP